MDDERFAELLIAALKSKLGRELARLARQVVETDAGLVDAAIVEQNRIIVEAVSGVCDVAVDAIMGRSRKPRISRARVLAMALCRELTAASFPEIGRLYGRDHTTVMSACKSAAAGDDKRAAAKARAVQAMGIEGGPDRSR